MAEPWVKRLLDAVDESDMTLSAIYKAVPVNYNYFRDMREKGSEPAIGKFLRICEVIGRDPVEILLGQPLPDKRALEVANDFLALSEEEQFALKLFISNAIAAREKVGD